MPGMQKIPEAVFLAAVEKLGPVQPIDLRKELKAGDSFLIGAMLSELVAKGTVVISKTRRGGSPFYYFPSKPETLEKISQYLNEKDRRTCALLKEQRVLREDAVEPLTRVGLQNIFDFSRKFVVVQDGAEVAYWRYYLVPEDEARKIVLGTSAQATAPTVASVNVVPAGVVSAPVISSASITPVLEHELVVAVKQESAQNKEPVKEMPLEKEIKMPSPALEKKRAPRKKTAKKEPEQSMLSSVEDWTIHDTLFENVQKFAKEQKAVISGAQSIKAHAELTCILTADGSFGKISLFVIALNKKKIVERDITTALLARGQGLPLLVLSVEEIPAKVVKVFADAPNVYFRQLT